MGLFNIFSTSQSNGREQSPARSERRLSPDYVPAIIAELQEARQAVGNTLTANERHPNTHPHLVTQAQLDKIAEPALQGAYTSENEQIQRANEQLERTLKMMGLTEQPPITPQATEAKGFTVPNDLSAEAIPRDLIAEAQARVAASYRTAQPSVSTPQSSTDVQTPTTQERQNV